MRDVIKRHCMSWCVRIQAPIPKRAEMDRKGKKIYIYIMCHVIHVMYHLSLTQRATATSPPHANSPIMHSRLVSKSQKIQFFFYWNSKPSSFFFLFLILAIHSLTRSLTREWVFCHSTHTQTHNRWTSPIVDWIDLRANSVNIFFYNNYSFLQDQNIKDQFTIKGKPFIPSQDNDDEKPCSWCRTVCQKVFVCQVL